MVVRAIPPEELGAEFDAGGGGGGGGRALLSPFPGKLDREDKAGGGGGGGFPPSPPVPPEAPWPACDSSGGGAPGFARDTKGGGAPTAPAAPGRGPIPDSRLFITTASRAGGGGASTGAATGAIAFRVAAAKSKCPFSFLRASPPPPLTPPLAPGEAKAGGDANPFRGELGVPPPLAPTEGEGSSDIPSMEGLCSPQSSAVSAMLLMSPEPELPASVAASDDRDSGVGASA